MLRGFNSDIQARGRRYHVQTEDWGHENPFIVTRVFREGAVLRTFKTPYEEALRAATVRTSEGLKLALQRQHADVIDALIAGRL